MRGFLCLFLFYNRTKPKLSKFVSLTRRKRYDRPSQTTKTFLIRNIAPTNQLLLVSFLKKRKTSRSTTKEELVRRLQTSCRGEILHKPCRGGQCHRCIITPVALVTFGPVYWSTEESPPPSVGAEDMEKAISLRAIHV